MLSVPVNVDSRRNSAPATFGHGKNGVQHHSQAPIQTLEELKATTLSMESVGNHRNVEPHSVDDGIAKIQCSTGDQNTLHTFVAGAASMDVFCAVKF